jgi:hypothetical protein
LAATGTCESEESMGLSVGENSTFFPTFSLLANDRDVGDIAVASGEADLASVCAVRGQEPESIGRTWWMMWMSVVDVGDWSRRGTPRFAFIQTVIQYSYCKN